MSWIGPVQLNHFCVLLITTDKKAVKVLFCHDVASALNHAILAFSSVHTSQCATRLDGQGQWTSNTKAWQLLSSPMESRAGGKEGEGE